VLCGRTKNAGGIRGLMIDMALKISKDLVTYDLYDWFLNVRWLRIFGPGDEWLIWFGLRVPMLIELCYVFLLPLKMFIIIQLIVIPFYIEAEYVIWKKDEKFHERFMWAMIIIGMVIVGLYMFGLLVKI
jgi:hypothetical protein